MDEEAEEAAAARRYRHRAIEVRAIAEGMEDLQSRSKLLRLAKDYECLARLRIAVGRAERGMKAMHGSDDDGSPDYLSRRWSR
jgi:hypothetical protein